MTILPEAAANLKRIDDLRGQIASILSTLTPEALNWRPVEGSDNHAMNSVACWPPTRPAAYHFPGNQIFQPDQI